MELEGPGTTFLKATLNIKCLIITLKVQNVKSHEDPF